MISTQKAYAVRKAAAIKEWEGILPPWYAEKQAEWERCKMARAMEAAGFNRKDIGRTLGVGANRVSSILQYGSCAAQLYREHKARGLA